MGWGIGGHRATPKKHYKVLCPVCGDAVILTKTQYLNQLRFRCMKCQALRPIHEELSERIYI